MVPDESLVGAGNPGGRMVCDRSGQCYLPGGRSNGSSIQNSLDLYDSSEKIS